MSQLGAVLVDGVRQLYDKNGNPSRDPLEKDFGETQRFKVTIDDQEAKFVAYAPLGFAHLRKMRGFGNGKYEQTLAEPVKEIVNPGRSGAKLFVSADNSVVLKSIDHKENAFLLQLLTSYYNEIHGRPSTLLPVFLGLYRVHIGRETVYIIAMQNIFQTPRKVVERYDLKGSVYKRFASEQERAKKSPTFKDQDWLERHHKPILLSPEDFAELKTTLEADVLFLRSFRIMDYSLLVGLSFLEDDEEEDIDTDPDASCGTKALMGDCGGKRVYGYIGIIDILQPYGLRKKMEYYSKSVVQPAGKFSVQPPGIYSRRFANFMTSLVFDVSGVPITKTVEPPPIVRNRRKSGVDLDAFTDMINEDFVVIVPDENGGAKVVGKPDHLRIAVQRYLPSILSRAKYETERDLNSSSISIDLDDSRFGSPAAMSPRAPHRSRIVTV